MPAWGPLIAALAAAAHEVSIMGLGYEGERHPLPCQLTAWPELGDAAAIGASMVAARPDVLVTIGDPWMFGGVPALAGESQRRAADEGKSLSYRGAAVGGRSTSSWLVRSMFERYMPRGLPGAPKSWPCRQDY